MAPVPHRGTRNDSSLIADTAQFIADLRGMDAQELIDICNENGRKMYQISE